MGSFCDHGRCVSGHGMDVSRVGRVEKEALTARTSEHNPEGASMTVIGWRTPSHSNAGNTSCVEVGWRTSSFSNGENGSCVEVGSFRTSTRSNGENGSCVEVAPGTAACHVAMRDTTDRDGGTLLFDASSWSQFVAAVS